MASLVQNRNSSEVVVEMGYMDSPPAPQQPDVDFVGLMNEGGLQPSQSSLQGREIKQEEDAGCCTWGNFSSTGAVVLGGGSILTAVLIFVDVVSPHVTAAIVAGGGIAGSLALWVAGNHPPGAKIVGEVKKVEENYGAHVKEGMRLAGQYTDLVAKQGELNTRLNQKLGEVQGALSALEKENGSLRLEIEKAKHGLGNAQAQSEELGQTFEELGEILKDLEKDQKAEGEEANSNLKKLEEKRKILMQGWETLCLSLKASQENISALTLQLEEESKAGCELKKQIDALNQTLEERGNELSTQAQMIDAVNANVQIIPKKIERNRGLREAVRVVLSHISEEEQKVSQGFWDSIPTVRNYFSNLEPGREKARKVEDWRGEIFNQKQPV